MVRRVSRNELALRVGRAIRSERLAKCLRQVALAELMEVDPVTVRRWESGVRLPTMVEVANLGSILGSDALCKGLFGKLDVYEESWKGCCDGGYLAYVA
ncbi:MAG: helix-turn-helix transcriptional regulator [Chloroflexi bacterium]|nr:helix-turn-helix transcriptional regulator [Chloroflexota bacterium]